MKNLTMLGLLTGALAFIGCSEDSTTGPTERPKENPFKGEWAYIKYVAYENGGEDTVDYSDEKRNDRIIFHDSTGTAKIDGRPTSARDSIHYYFTEDSLYVTSFVDNFLNYVGRPYEFKGQSKDTLDFSDASHIEVLIRAK